MAIQEVDRPLPTPGLYYPYADFQSESWVKLAILNWSRIERIKPLNYPYEDRASTRELLELGWLRDTGPNLLQLAATADKFTQFIEVCGRSLQSRYAIDQREVWPKAHFGTSPPGADERLAYICASSSFMGVDEKINARMASLLRRKGLALVYFDHGFIWLGLHPRLAYLYMCALAERIADDRQLVPITDDEKVYRAAAGHSTLSRLEEALIGDRTTKPSLEEVQSQYIDITLRSVLTPVDIEELSVERVVDFRGTHGTELQAFQDHVFGLRKEILKISQIADAREIQLRLRDLYAMRTEPELRDLQNKLRKFGIRSVPDFLQLRINKDTAVQTMGGVAALAGGHFLLGPAAPVAMPFAISVAVIPYVRRKQEERERLRHESPASLLLAVKRELATR